MGNKFNPLDYLFILRPLILIPCWNFLLIGAWLARGKSGFTNELILAFIGYTAIMGGTYILNQIMDIESDRVNKKLFLLSKGYIPTKFAWLELIILWILAIFLSLKFNKNFLIFIIISIIMGVLYSVPPIKLKGRPFLDMLSNGIGYGMINMGLGWLVFATFEWSIFYKFLPYFLSICAVFINTTIVDIRGDTDSGELTTAVFLKEGISYILSTGLMGAAIISAFLFKDPVCLIPAVISFPLFIYSTGYYLSKNQLSRRATIASFRLPGVIFTLITAFLYPPYLLILIAVILGMRLYYKKRFNISYPTLTGG